MVRGIAYATEAATNPIQGSTRLKISISRFGCIVKRDAELGWRYPSPYLICQLGGRFSANAAAPSAASSDSHTDAINSIPMRRA